MKIENVAFPYPVLGIGNDITSNFTWHYSVDQNNYEYLITIDIQLNNKSIEDYIKYDLADYICEIECTYTFIRKCIPSKYGHFDIKLSKSEIAREVTVELSVVVKETIENYQNKQLNPIYSGYQISLEPGDLMAYIGRFKFNADIVFEKLKRIDTYMIIREDATIAQTDFKLDSVDGKIEILIPSVMYKHYKEVIKGNSSFRKARRPVCVSGRYCPYSTLNTAEVIRLPLRLLGGIFSREKSRLPRYSAFVPFSSSCARRIQSGTVCWPSASAVITPCTSGRFSRIYLYPVFSATPFPWFTS